MPTARSICGIRYRQIWRRKTLQTLPFLLRRGSEDFFESVCDKLGAKLVYNSNMRWQLDDWLFAAMGEYKRLLKEGKRAASSWDNQKDENKFFELGS